MYAEQEERFVEAFGGLCNDVKRIANSLEQKADDSDAIDPKDFEKVKQNFQDTLALIGESINSILGDESKHLQSKMVALRALAKGLIKTYGKE